MTKPEDKVGGRPAGDVRKALLAAAEALVASGQQPTMRELAAAACVGVKAAGGTVKNLKRDGHLVRMGDRRVAYRNRPVATWAPAHLAQPEFPLQSWSRAW